MPLLLAALSTVSLAAAAAVSPASQATSVSAASAAPSAKPRARDLGVPFDGTPGPLNAITDVAGVTVGHTTLISGSGKLRVGEGPVRTGVTAVLPRGRDSLSNPVFAAWFAQNGNGEMTGTAWVEESGFLEGPVMITNTHSVGVVRDAVIQWRVAHAAADATGYYWSLPVVAETWDGWLNDINGFHVKPEHALHALDGAHAGAVEEGSVGGGTGMICNGYKGGIGTRRAGWTPRTAATRSACWCNAITARRDNLRIAGIPVGREIPRRSRTPSCPRTSPSAAPSSSWWRPMRRCCAHQLKRRRPPRNLGAGPQRRHIRQRLGRHLHRFFDRQLGRCRRRATWSNLRMLPNDSLDPVFRATVEATEEAIVNAMVAAQDMMGVDDHRVIALPHAALRAVLKKYGRLAP